MNVCIKIETGDLGMKAGVASTVRAGNVFSIVVDPSRLPKPSNLVHIMKHEIMHVLATIEHERQQAEKRALWDHAADFTINEALKEKK